VARDTGPDATDLLARVRAHLADDLDTPGALAAVDAWAGQARDRGGRDGAAPRQVRDAVDALLGVAL
jgi:L-cysteine:1D-myo-inositol 2-amino-2-deoxy-alpha-D-glucopyranoside ligase